jgi:hypothetical protein
MLEMISVYQNLATLNKIIAYIIGIIILFHLYYEGLHEVQHNNDILNTIINVINRLHISQVSNERLI